MNDALDKALHAYRFWRDRGEDILIAALLAEFLIEALWPEHRNWSPWDRTSTTGSVRCWRFKHSLTRIVPSRKQAMVVAAFIVLLGVAVERIWGTLADDKSDEIRTNLQERLIGISPRIWLFSGDALNRVASRVKPFSGQRVAMFENWQSVDDKEELQLFVFSLNAVLGGAGWLNHNGQIIDVDSTGRFNNLSLDPPNRSGVHGVLIEASKSSLLKTKRAANALADALISEQLFAYAHTEATLSDLSLPGDNIIAITVGARLP
jgi:hypothetical protein